MVVKLCRVMVKEVTGGCGIVLGIWCRSGRVWRDGVLSVVWRRVLWMWYNDGNIVCGDGGMVVVGYVTWYHQYVVQYMVWRPWYSVMWWCGVVLGGWYGGSRVWRTEHRCGIVITKVAWI